MSRNILCAVYFLIAISTVHSASYYFRAGREVIVPTVEEVKEVISELKNSEPVVVQEIVSVQAAPENVDAVVAAAVQAEPIVPAAVVKSEPSVAESVVPVVENLENNVVVAAVAEADVSPVSDEARAKPISSLRLETIEVIQPDVKPERVASVAETVKIAAVQAIEKQNEELVKAIESAAPAVPLTETKVVDAPVEKSEPIVENVDVASVKTADPVVVKTQDEIVVPAAVAAVEKVESVEKAQETVRSADPEPVKTDIVKEEKPIEEKPIEQPTEAEKIVEKSAEEPVKEVRQAAQQPNPLDAIQQGFQTIAQNFQNTIGK